MQTIKGKMKEKLAPQSGEGKNGTWHKQDFILNTGDKYKPFVCFTVFGEDKIALMNQHNSGDEVDVSYNLGSREFNGKWYTNAEAWKFESTGVTAQPTNTSPPAADGGDDLPF